MRYTKRDGNYTGKERKLWELENEIEDGKLIYVNTIENLPRMQGKTLLEKAQKFDLLKEKLENGTLIELPCKVGDTIYVVLTKPRIYKYKVKEIEMLKDETLYYLEIIDKDLPFYYNKLINRASQFGEFWFTDKAKAEQRLKELQNER